MLLGLIGYPLGHSLSPIMQNRALQVLGLQGTYLPFAVTEENLGSAVMGLKSLGCLGFNVTIPYKRKIIQYLDAVTPRAAEIGAVNLVYREGQNYIGDNSDAPGFIRSLEEKGIALKGKKAVIVGNGGAARAVATGLRDSGATIVVTSRQKPTAEFWQQFPWLGLKKDLVVAADLVIDCTPVGMYPDIDVPPVVDPRAYDKQTVFCDLVYNPRKTCLIKMAEATGHPTVTGEGMLLFQGAISFEKWLAREAPIEVMREALQECLEGGKKND